jgi:hypothetical protein
LTICAQKTELIGVFYVELFSAESLVAVGYLALALVFSYGLLLTAFRLYCRTKGSSDRLARSQLTGLRQKLALKSTQSQSPRYFDTDLCSF